MQDKILAEIQENVLCNAECRKVAYLSAMELERLGASTKLKIILNILTKSLMQNGSQKWIMKEGRPLMN